MDLLLLLNDLSSPLPQEQKCVPVAVCLPTFIKLLEIFFDTDTFVHVLDMDKGEYAVFINSCFTKKFL